MLGLLLIVGEPLGREVKDGIIVGVVLGFDEGENDGALEGLLSDGTLLGEKEGRKDGSFDVSPVGLCDGVSLANTNEMKEGIVRIMRRTLLRH